MADRAPAHASPKESISVEDLCLLANSFVEEERFDKAVQIYESACRLFPDNLTLKINLGRVRNIRNQTVDAPKDAPPASSRERSNRDFWANRYQGLGEIFLNQGKKEEAERVFEISKISNPNFYLPYLNLGRLYSEAGAFGKAVEEFEGANRLNPFNEEVVDLLAAAFFHTREYRESLKYAVDGLILSGEISRPQDGRYRSKIKATMERIPGFTAEMRNRLVRERRNRIQVLYEELYKEIDDIAPDAEIISRREDVSGAPAPNEEPARVRVPSDQEIDKHTYEMALQLRRHLIFRNMDDAAVLKVARFTSEKRVPAGDLVYQEGDPSYGLYFLNRGKVELQKNTPFGPIVFASFEQGGFFGDDNLLYGRERYVSAVAVQEAELLFVDKAGLTTIFAREKEIAIHFLWYFWQSLSQQIRESKERLMAFVSAPIDKTRQEPLNVQEKAGKRPARAELDKKMEVLNAQGLSPAELDLLARFSHEEAFNRGDVIFREGDAGDRFYVIREGAVLISRQAKGCAEEALAVLKKGDFFGEIALVGNRHRRFADARAQEQGTRVLVVTAEGFREILSIDTDSAYQILRILCRILTRRLAEMNETLYEWRLMSGGSH
ncbi:MAG: cyclic nucleotide-binding domain-containing protein [Pseudomonadota bacterium]